MEKNSTCPIYQTRYGPPKGNQSLGNIYIREFADVVPGYKDAKLWTEISNNMRTNEIR